MRRIQRFNSDTRGIEGLPVRLVTALVVGVASLSVMMNMISGISGATVIARGGSARLDGVGTATTDQNGVAKLELSPELRPNQGDGTVEFEVKPPAGSEYTDEQGNTALLVVSD
ncbi:MAG: carboxypeptidase regulatory-like domain-containing protein [Natronomonas sp.]|nr:carboxypeptidase regulatory-like domain-containing protein [Natronomonas sp.]